MSIFYDPQTRKAKVWVIVAYILVPVICVMGIWFYGQTQMTQKKSQQPIEEKDIFEKF